MGEPKKEYPSTCDECEYVEDGCVIRTAVRTMTEVETNQGWWCSWGKPRLEEKVTE